MKPIRTCRPASRNTLPHAPRVGEPDVGPFDLHPTPARAPCLAQRHRPRPLPSLFWSVVLVLGLPPSQSLSSANKLNETQRLAAEILGVGVLRSRSRVLAQSLHCQSIALVYTTN